MILWQFLLYVCGLAFLYEVCVCVFLLHYFLVTFRCRPTHYLS